MDEDVDRCRLATLKNQSPMGPIFFYAKCHVHMLRLNYPYDTRKPPKKFQGDLSRLPGGRPSQNEAYETRRPPKNFQGNPTCARPNLRWTMTLMAVGRKNIPYDTRKPPKKFQGHPSRLPGGRPRGSPSIKNQ
ncbi:uncharacterized protein G2W53_027117 [Senna tora]|uniref:Uncharacterized protein n=1 Tax=Senna tora TaxID=362788 RepID=A0A834WGA0_9FABA|nr:uncharacterized protein G2W53_027117 [Senna tora]